MTERWTDERLDRFADSVDRAIARHDQAMADSDARMTRIEESMASSDARMTRVEEAIARATDERQELREVFLTTVRVISESNQRQDAANAAFRDAIGAMQRQFSEIQADVREMQAEVRGLQVENRRIIDRVFGGE